jgi:hypothetical protein
MTIVGYSEAKIAAKAAKRGVQPVTYEAYVLDHANHKHRRRSAARSERRKAARSR